MDSYSESFRSSMIFALIKLCRLLQSGLDAVFSALFINIPLLFLKKEAGEDIGSPSPLYKIDLEKTHIRLFWHYLTCSFKISSLVSGVKLTEQLYDRLLILSKDIPVFGYIRKNSVRTFDILGPKTKDGYRCWDLHWQTRLEPDGHFKILEHDNSTGKTKIKCVWLSGNNAGKTFFIEKDINYTFEEVFSNISPIAPTNIYIPPKVAIWILYTVLALGLLPIVRIFKESWELLSKFFS